jgi:hypothetical protein
MLSASSRRVHALNIEAFDKIRLHKFRRPADHNSDNYLCHHCMIRTCNHFTSVDSDFDLDAMSFMIDPVVGESLESWGYVKKGTLAC